MNRHLIKVASNLLLGRKFLEKHPKYPIQSNFLNFHVNLPPLDLLNHPLLMKALMYFADPTVVIRRSDNML